MKRSARHFYPDSIISAFGIFLISVSALFASAFAADPAPPAVAKAGVPANAPNDLNGDGKTDFIVVRADRSAATAEMFRGASTREKLALQRELAGNNSPEGTTGVNWYALTNGSGAFTQIGWGISADFFVLDDFDGDGKDDYAVWRPGALGAAAFYILQSSTNTLKSETLGQTGDDPTIVGDWDGDGKADATVFRGGTAGAPQSFFYFRGSLNNPNGVITSIPWGTTGDIAYTLDYDGDNKLDPAVLRDAGGGIGLHFVARSSSNFTAFEQIYYGLATDFVVPGDYDGDGRDDIALSRTANFGTGAYKYFFIREADGGGNPNNVLQWGVAEDLICQGDYDGDGKTDIGVWRPAADPAENFFYIIRSSDGALLSQEWGQNGDFPVNNWNVH